jgi:hypothetical protein
LLVAFGTAPTACGGSPDEPAPASAGGTAGQSAAGTGGAGAGGGGANAGGDAGEASGGGEAGSGRPDFPCDVGRAIEAKCQRCHTDPPRNGAPFPILTWDDTRAPYGLAVVYEAMLVAVESGFMPLTELSLSPPVEDLTPEEKTTLVSWLRAGAPPAETDERCNR